MAGNVVEKNAGLTDQIEDRVGEKQFVNGGFVPLLRQNSKITIFKKIHFLTYIPKLGYTFMVPTTTIITNRKKIVPICIIAWTF